MKITVLLENTKCRDDLTCEHGLSLYIETNGKKILFDAGQTDAFAANAEKLGINLETVDFAILSHGHYDHGGGLGRFLEINKTAKIYASPYAFGRHFHGKEKYIGLDRALPRERFVSVTEKIELAPGIIIDPCPQLPARAGSQGLLVQKNGNWEPETFRHEQYLLIMEGEKRYLFSGCSHRGAVNIAEYFQPDVFVGGFHLSKAGEEETLAAANQLAVLNTTYYTGHCTGETQFAWMKSILGGRLFALPTGMAVEL